MKPEDHETEPNIVHFHCTFNLEGGFFNVVLILGNHKYIEQMRPDRFEKFCSQLPRKIEISGTNVKFEGSPNACKAVKQDLTDYFRAVLQSWKEHKEQGGHTE